MRKNRQEDDVMEQHTYAITILFNNDQTHCYKFTNVPAATSEEAIDKMKRYVAVNGHFGSMSADEVFNKLSATDVQEI